MKLKVAFVLTFPKITACIFWYKGQSLISKLWNSYNFLEIRAKHTVGNEYVKKTIEKKIIVTVNVFCN
jgi:hypothetical protein